MSDFTPEQRDRRTDSARVHAHYVGSPDPVTARAEEIRESTGCAWEIACQRAEAERDAREHTCDAFGPLALRVRWEDDPEPYDPGDFDDAETWAAVERYGVLGCVIETRAPACPCCGFTSWDVAASLWSIVGDADYHREIERELIVEATAV